MDKKFEGQARKLREGGYWNIENESMFIYPEARRNAMAILEHALERCKHENMRTPEVREALDYLAKWCYKAYALQVFWSQLLSPDPHDRYIRVRNALDAIRRDLPMDVVTKGEKY